MENRPAKLVGHIWQVTQTKGIYNARTKNVLLIPKLLRIQTVKNARPNWYRVKLTNIYAFIRHVQTREILSTILASAKHALTSLFQHQIIMTVSNLIALDGGNTLVRMGNATFVLISTFLVMTRKVVFNRVVLIIKLQQRMELATIVRKAQDLSNRPGDVVIVLTRAASIVQLIETSVQRPTKFQRLLIMLMDIPV